MSLAILLAQHPPAWLRHLVDEARSPRTEGMVGIPGGDWRPLFEVPEQRVVTIEPFHLDRDPVTNAEFLRFVRYFANYRRGQISELFADAGYLSHWGGPTLLGPAGPQLPVVNVSWFAARTYCSVRDARLPTEAEWEYAAAAGETRPDGVNEPGFSEKLLAWYARPVADLPAVGQSRPNYYGVRDLNALVWEWVLDFNGSLLTDDTRDSKPTDTQAFCGAGALGARDSRDYAAFMRAAFRSSLAASYTARSLGFRCAKSRKKGGSE